MKIWLAWPRIPETDFSEIARFQNPFNDSYVETKSNADDPKAAYLVKLEGVLDTPHKVQGLAKIIKLPPVKEGSGATGHARFCLINGKAKAILASTLRRKMIAPTFIRINTAAKDLSPYCFAPTLLLTDPTSLNTAATIQTTLSCPP